MHGENLKLMLTATWWDKVKYKQFQLAHSFWLLIFISIICLY